MSWLQQNTSEPTETALNQEVPREHSVMSKYRRRPCIYECMHFQYTIWPTESAVKYQLID